MMLGTRKAILFKGAAESLFAFDLKLTPPIIRGAKLDL